MVRRLGLGKNNHLSYASLALNPRLIYQTHFFFFGFGPSNSVIRKDVEYYSGSSVYALKKAFAVVHVNSVHEQMGKKKKVYLVCFFFLLP